MIMMDAHVMSEDPIPNIIPLYFRLESSQAQVIMPMILDLPRINNFIHSPNNNAYKKF